MQDGWVVQIRRRKSGKNQGALYMVYVTPQGRLRYTLSLGLEYMRCNIHHNVKPYLPDLRGQAKEDGFTDPNDLVKKARAK